MNGVSGQRPRAPAFTLRICSTISSLLVVLRLAVCAAPARDGRLGLWTVQHATTEEVSRDELYIILLIVSRQICAGNPCHMPYMTYPECVRCPSMLVLSRQTPPTPKDTESTKSNYFVAIKPCVLGPFAFEALSLWIL